MERMKMNFERKFAGRMLSFYRGRDCVGFLLNRGPRGFEAFDQDQHSIGLLSDQHAAAAAVSQASQ